MDININGKAYKFASLTMEHWAHIVNNYDLENPEQYPDLIHYLTGAPIELLQQAEEETLTLAVAFVVQMLNLRVPTDMKDLETLSFGEFIDLDIYLNMGADKHYDKIFEILEVKKDLVEFGLYAIDTYNKYRIYIYRQYKKLFELEDDAFEADAESTETIDPLSLARNWYKIIVSLANEDLLKIDEVTEQPLKKALNFMAYQKEKQLEENLKQLQRKREHDLQRNRRSY
jgi:hypothetical protein